MSPEIIGILIYYFATGEGGRLQFIGDNSLGKDGKVCNYDEIYDVQVGDIVDGVALTDESIEGYIKKVFKETEIRAALIPVVTKSWSSHL